MPWDTRSKFLFAFGILIIIAGAFPFLQNLSALKPFIGLLPSSGMFYNAAVLVLGALCILFIGRKKARWGPKHRLAVLLIGALLFLWGALPLLKNTMSIPAFIPLEGSLYSVVVIIIGAFALVLGRPTGPARIEEQKINIKAKS